MKKLFKDQSTKMICGVCSGLAQYFNIDPTIVRIIWVVASLILVGIGGVLVYAACALILPDKSTIE